MAKTSYGLKDLLKKKKNVCELLWIIPVSVKCLCWCMCVGVGGFFFFFFGGGVFLNMFSLRGCAL